VWHYLAFFYFPIFQLRPVAVRGCPWAAPPNHPKTSEKRDPKTVTAYLHIRHTHNFPLLHTNPHNSSPSLQTHLNPFRFSHLHSLLHRFATCLQAVFVATEVTCRESTCSIPNFWRGVFIFPSIFFLSPASSSQYIEARALRTVTHQAQV